jgi:hypothetical protein
MDLLERASLLEELGGVLAATDLEASLQKALTLIEKAAADRPKPHLVTLAADRPGGLFNQAGARTAANPP